MRASKLLLIIIFLNLFLIQNPVLAKEDFKIEINLWENSLLVFKNGKLMRSLTIAQGKEESPTPIGHFFITNKAKDWGGGFGTRWLGLNVPWGVYGIHGTNRPYLIGRNVSHGCVRMRNHDVEWLYTHIPVGTPVDIIGPIRGLETNLVLSVGSKGTLVYLIQQRLKLAGYYSGIVNGYFNKQTEQAIERYQKKHHLTVTGHGNQRLYLELGLLE